MFFFFFNFHLENIFFGPIFNRCFLNGGLLAKKLMEIVKRKEGGNPHPPNGILCDWYFWTHSLDREKIENATQYSHSISFKSQGVRFPVSFVLQRGLYFNCLDCWLVGWLVFEAADAYFMFLLFCSALHQSKLRRALAGDRFYALHGGHPVLSLPN